MTVRTKTRRCKVCRGEFEPRTALHSVCSYDCAVKQADAKAEKAARAIARAERAKLRERREKARPRSWYVKAAQVACNAYIRVRDADQPCISCGRFHAGAYDAGHYRSAGAAPELRFHPDNIHKQCVPCNQHKSGNAIEYRIGLVKRIGLERVEWLEGPHEPKHYTVDELKAIRADFVAKKKALEARK